MHACIIGFCTARLYNLQASLLLPRNLFRTPGIGHFDVAVVKEFKLPKESTKPRFNADFLNIFNHANLYAYPGSNVFSGATSQVVGRRGIDAANGKDQRNIQMALHLIFQFYRSGKRVVEAIASAPLFCGAPGSAQS